MAEIENEFIGYGFVDSISRPRQEASSYERLNIVLDFISADAFESGKGPSRDAEDLSIVRVMTTDGRLENIFGLGKISEGTWLKIRLGDKSGNPPAWIIGAREDYSGYPRRTNVVGLEQVFEEHGAPRGKLFTALNKLCDFKQFHSNQTRAIQQNMSPPIHAAAHLRVVDVGQASFCAIHTLRDPDSPILGYFDVGGPVFFHHRSFPSTFTEATRIPKNGFVALSHWDFDHYSLAVTSLKTLQNLTWLAPNQPVGPNAARLQSLLGANLTLLNASSFIIAPGLVLYRGMGMATDRNNNGFVLSASTASGNILLAGDVGYDMIPASAQNGLVGINISHHGGTTTGTPPSPANSRSVAAVSYGVPNRYRHPDAKSLAAHQKLGWKVMPTCPLTTPRGDVWLG